MLAKITKTLSSKLTKLMAQERELINKIASAKTQKEALVLLKKAKAIRSKFHETRDELDYVFRITDIKNKGY